MKWLAGLWVLFLASSASAITVEMVAVGQPGNLCDTQSQGCFGAVGYEYQIGKYEITNAQYMAFLNAVAATDTNGLYNAAMLINRAGSPGTYTYTSSEVGTEDAPVTSLSFYDALRFANWLHNGQPAGAQTAATTEDGAYAFTGPTTVGARKVSAKFALATEDEWYKAAYYDGTVYFDYPAGSNTLMTCATPTATPNRANCGNVIGVGIDVGSYTGSPSPSGTFDQGGNVWEWNETVVGVGRGVRGGAAHLAASFTGASTQLSNDPAAEENLVGFRVVALGFPTVEMVAVGNPGNGCDSQPQGCFGAVAYPFEIGKYEITNAQYAAFLHAVAATDTNGLYNVEMLINRTGSPGSYSYTALVGAGNAPVISLSFYDALRFANWLHNGRPTGAQNTATTEDGAYLFSGPTTVGARKAGAAFALPTENEWYKAAYFNGTVYFDHPAGSNTLLTCSTPTATPNSANCNNVIGIGVEVGSYTGSPSPYGTFDQGGNVWEWNETVVGVGRGVRGGAAHLPASFAGASTQQSNDPAAEENLVGFRVVPEPEAAIQIVAGLSALIGLALARRR